MCADCVVLLDNRVQNQITTRLLRVVKYRGSTHGTNEYPFLIDEKGISVLPLPRPIFAITPPSETVPTGILGLDDMLGAGGYHKGSSVLISGASGSGKTIFARISRPRPAPAGSAACTSHLKNRPGKSFATFDPSESIYKSIWTRDCCGSKPPARPFMALKCTWQE